jgi:hypothetical protein
MVTINSHSISQRLLTTPPYMRQEREGIRAWPPAAAKKAANDSVSGTNSNLGVCHFFFNSPPASWNPFYINCNLVSRGGETRLIASSSSCSFVPSVFTRVAIACFDHNLWPIL